MDPVLVGQVAIRAEMQVSKVVEEVRVRPRRELVEDFPELAIRPTVEVQGDGVSRAWPPRLVLPVCRRELQWPAPQTGVGHLGVLLGRELVLHRSVTYLGNGQFAA